MVTKENQRFLLVYKVMNDIVTIIQKIKPYDWSKTMMNEIIAVIRSLLSKNQILPTAF
jgi:hypothetical protein